MATALDEAATVLRERIRELDAERRQLERALANLTGDRAGKRRPGRPRGSTTRTRRRGRRGTRADQAVRLIKANPGIGASEIAKKMGIQPNYLYRVLADLQKNGRVKKSGRTYSAA
jgi:DNA invertase Pin-like site-specific DNA recombinase